MVQIVVSSQPVKVPSTSVEITTTSFFGGGAGGLRRRISPCPASLLFAGGNSEGSVAALGAGAGVGAGAWVGGGIGTGVTGVGAIATGVLASGLPYFRNRVSSSLISRDDNLPSPAWAYSS